MLTGLGSVGIEVKNVEGEYNIGCCKHGKRYKKVHPEDVVYYKVGAFVQSFWKDAYIMSYLFQYSLRDAKENVLICGFPKNSISKVCARLEQKR